MRTYPHVLPIFIILLTTAACRDSGSIPPAPDIPDVPALPSDSVAAPLTPIDTRLFLSPREVLERSGRYIRLDCCTERTYGFSGGRIFASLNVHPTGLDLRFDSIYVSTYGLIVWENICRSIDLPTLSTGSHLIRMDINGTPVASLLTITDSRIEFRVQPNNMLASLQPVTMRIPLPLIWGAAGSYSPDLYRAFLDSLRELGATPYTLLPGNYHYFTVDSVGGFDAHLYTGTHYSAQFLYRFPYDTLLTRNLVKRFAHRHRADSLTIYLYGGRGEYFSSNMLRMEP
jgi:hypothetical protein